MVVRASTALMGGDLATENRGELALMVNTSPLRCRCADHLFGLAEFLLYRSR